MFNENQTDRINQLENEIRLLKIQLKQTEQQHKTLIQKSDSTFRAVFDHSADGMMLIDSKGIIREWNSGNERITGLDKEFVVGKMLLWKASELLFPFEKLPEDGYKKIKTYQKSLVTNMREGTLIREIKNYKTGEYKILNIVYFPVTIPGRVLLGAICRDVTQEARYQEQLEEKTSEVIARQEELVNERDRLKNIGDNFPGGSLFRRELDSKTGISRYTYLSKTWKKVTGLDIQKSLDDLSYVINAVLPEDRQLLLDKMNESKESIKNYLTEIRLRHPSGQIRWLQVDSRPHYINENQLVYDGFVLDVTARKKDEAELKKYRNELEFLVKERTEALQVVNEELQVNNEELQAINEELHATSEELYATNEELEKYKTQLEEMVDEKTKEVIARQEELEKLTLRQEVFIKVMQILQLEEDVSKGMNTVLNIIGGYILVDRVQVWENNTDGLTYGCSYEWCNEGIEPNIQFRQNLPIAYAQPWLNILMAEKMICTSDIYTLSPGIHKMLEKDGVKSILVLPLSIYSSQFGFIAYHVCKFHKEWDVKEVELLTNMAQIFSNVIRRRQVETAMNLSQQTMRTVLDNINASISVFEYESLKILFANNKFRKDLGEDVEGKICWQALKSRSCPCEHCPQSILLDSDGRPTGIHHWEDFSPITNRWYFVISTAIKWVNGQMAIMELATDITDLKMNEIELVRAREKAEESDKLKSAFLANMSHEIRTPVNGIVGFLHFIASNDLSRERKENYLSIIKNSTEQLVQLIDDIIDVSKIEARQMKIFPVSVNINQLMIELQIFFESYMQTRNKMHVMLILDDSQFIDQCMTIADPMRLRQVLNNLINNAVKYTDKGYIRFGYRQSAPDKLEFLVEDTGVGMAANQHELIFERFRQSENHLRGGTGLGLSIAQNLVKMMGGDIWVESTEGVGSVFYFTITYLPVTNQ